jgi:hypothetical protein
MVITAKWQYQLTTVIYQGISTLEIKGVFITLAVNYRGI